jgi:hypothetical protein
MREWRRVTAASGTTTRAAGPELFLARPSIADGSQAGRSRLRALLSARRAYECNVQPYQSPCNPQVVIT